MNALFQNVLTASFHGSIVILAVLILRLLLGKAAPKKYLCYLWVLAGLRLLMPFDIQSDLSLQPQTMPDSVIRWEQPASMWRGAPDASPETLPEDQAENAETPDFSAEDAAAPEAPGAAAPSFLVPLFWGIVAAAFLGYNLYSYLALRKKVLGAKKIPGGWETDGIETAFILGFVKPQIYIPTGMSPETRKYILAHERTHLDKADHWVKMLGFLALAIHWFNPLVWLAYILLCKDIEMACDERVVQFMELPERKEYSTALLNCSSSHVHYAASPVAFGEVNVKNRIKSILNYRNPSFWSGLLSVVAIIFVTVCLVTNPTRQDAADAKDTPPRAFAVASQPPMEENPDWGVGIIADVQSPTTMNLYLGVGVDGAAWDGTPVCKERGYTLERWNGEAWEPLPRKAPAAEDVNDWRYTLGEDEISGVYSLDTLDWSTLYGPLSEGDYRIVLSMVRPGEKRPFHAWFHVYANALTGEEAEAYARVESSLKLLQQCRSYTATISESSSQGTLLTTSVITSWEGHANINFYTGEFCYSSYPCLSTDEPVASWTEAFYPPENAYLSFSEAEGKISDQELCLTASREDGFGNLLRDVFTYTLGDDGKLTGVDILRQSTASDGSVTQSRRAVSVVYSSSYIPQEAQTPKDSFEASQDSPWNIFFRVDDDCLVPNGGEVWMSLGSSHIGVSNYSADGHYWLEKRNDSRWDTLETKADDPAWSDETYRLKNSTIAVQVDWSKDYGALEPGLYRMGKRFYNGEESIIQYAEFQVYPTGGISGAGGQEAIDRVRAAVEKVRQGNYCVSMTVSHDFSASPGSTLNNVFWKYDEICATDYYDNFTGAYHHSGIDTKDEKDADLFYDQWVRELDLDAPNLCIYFPTGDSVISGREISFTATYTVTTLDDLIRYTVLFDEGGDLRSIEIYRDGPHFNGWTRVLTVEDRPESEIQAHVEKVQAEQA